MTERLLLLLEARGFAFPPAQAPHIFFCNIGESALKIALTLCDELTLDGLRAELDVMGRGLKAQMKYANKIGALFTAVIGDDDIEKGVVTIRNMQTGEESESDFMNFAENFENLVLQATIEEFGVTEDEG